MNTSGGHADPVDVEVNSVVIGGEVALGATHGDDAGGDFSLRVQADNIGVTPLLMIERRIF